jgi:hypothetical protein
MGDSVITTWVALWFQFKGPVRINFSYSPSGTQNSATSSPTSCRWPPDVSTGQTSPNRTSHRCLDTLIKLGQIIYKFQMIRIQTHWRNPDPIQNVSVQSGSRTRFYGKKNFFLSNPSYVFLTPYEGHSGIRRSLHPKRELFKHEIFL